MRIRSLIAAFVLVVIAGETSAQETHPFSVDDMVAMERVSGMALSPDGSRLVFVKRVTDLEANKGRTDLWRIDANGKNLRQLTTDPASDHSAIWAPDNGTIYFLSSRSGSSQIWKMSADGGEPEPVSDLPLDVSNLQISPDGRLLAFSLEVFPDCETIECTVERLDAQKNAPGSARIIDNLLYRHWDTWKDGRRNHLFVMETAGSDPVDVTPGMDTDIPSKPWGGTEEFSFTPDSQGIVFAARDVGRTEAWSTDFDLFVARSDGSREPRKLFDDNPAWDTQPTFSPDGETLAYLAMTTPGYESDRYRIVLRRWYGSHWEVGEPTWLTEEWDRSPHSITWADDSTIVTHAPHLGQRPLFKVNTDNGEVKQLTESGTVRSEAVSGRRVFFRMDSLTRPAELYWADLRKGNPEQITHINDERVDAARMGEPRQYTFTGAHGDEVYGYIVPPVDFDASKTYPVAFLIHGGPQGSFGNSFSYRWNPQAYAGAGYAVVMVDFHGSVGYGQKFTDSINDDWGGAPLTDLKLGLEAALAENPWMDGDRVAAAGASYGGYMIAWIAGNWPDRFRCLVNHDGVFDIRYGYYGTEELWFPEHDFRGTPWENPESYTRNNPIEHVANWQTPMLVIHGELDYRVPFIQGVAAFTALQRRDVPSRMVVFPDENHWVLKPRNSIQWHQEVLGWMDRWTKAEAPGK